ncbi:MAG TPA: 3-phosphoshikimate 1-carboxyvinyltransferase [Enhygromyxa sp.]|nr:3-phosphoshikimate 1-carboxyvinyltransferase [Enhygromyxa sp.]
MPASLRLERPNQPIGATLRPPGSKSLSNRALLLAAMAEGRTRIEGCLDAEDTQRMLECLARLGVEVVRTGERIEDGLELEGSASLGSSRGAIELDVGTAGTVARFLTAALAAARSPGWESVLIDGSPRMRERPMDSLLDALAQLGASLEPLGKPGALPVRLRLDGQMAVGEGLAGGELILDRPASSQFVSALLIAGCLARRPIEIVLREGTPARPYVDMTLATIAAFGGNAYWESKERLVVQPSTLRACPRYAVEPDASAASYLLALPAIWGGEVTIEGLGSASLQGDAEFVRVLERFGAEVEQGREHTTVRGTGRLRGQTLELADMPDTTLTAAVIALFCEGPTTITGVEVLRHHESDRIAAAATELRKLGAEVRELDDGLAITPPIDGPRSGVAIDTYLDHRMAMAFAMVGDVVINDPRCVDKTFPEYFEVLGQLGIRSA